MVMTKQICCIAAVLLLLSTQTWAAVSAFVDRNPVALDESLTLTIESDGGGDAPDFSLLQNDFDLLGQSSNTSLQIINGQVSRKQQWQVQLMAKHAGEIQIPAFAVGGEKSQPLLLNVTAGANPQQAQQSDDIFIEVSAAPKNVYVQQQLLYTVKLYFSLSMADGNTLSEPKVTGGDAIVVKLGDNRQYQTTVNGRRYGVMEQQYALYPQKSGALTIEPLVFEGNVVEQGRSGGSFFDPFNQTTRHVRLRSKAVKFEVQPMPASITAHWLPAHSVQLLEQWSEEPPKFVVGEPITRTLAVMADGLTAAQLPVVGHDLPAGLKSYPDQPQLKDTKDAKGVTGLRQEKIALIPTQPGTLTLPAIELTWWNTDKKQLEKARLPERTVTVAAGSGIAAPQANSVTSQPQMADQTVSNDTSALADVAKLTNFTTTAGWWPWLALVFGIAWLITLIAWWRRGAVVKPVTTSKTAADQQRLQPLELRLRKACQQNDAIQSKAALLAWAKARWPQQPPVSLPSIANLCPTPLAEPITALDRALYAEGNAAWQGQQLWQVFEQHKPVDDLAGKTNTAGLEPLYRA